MRPSHLFGMLLLVCVFLIGGFSTALAAEESQRDLAPGLIVPDAARPGPDFDVDAATQAYIDLLSPEQRNIQHGRNAQ